MYLYKIWVTQKKEESFALIKLMQEVMGHPPKMWGPSIIGYGSYDYKYESGREGTMARAGFSPRKAAMTVYLMGNYCDRQAEVDGAGIDAIRLAVSGAAALGVLGM